MIGSLLAAGEQKLRELGLGGYLDEGAETGRVLQLSRQYIDSLTIEMRVIDAVEASTDITIFGRKFSTPVMSAALSGLNKICPDPMVQVARGVKAAGAAMGVGIGDAQELQQIIDTGAAVFKIVKPYRDWDLLVSKLQDAQQRGAMAVGIDIDFIFGGKRNDTVFRANIMAPRSSQELRELVNCVQVPFILKGVLSVADAVKAVEIGAGAIVVSHHGGAVMDYAVPPLQILPEIAAAVRGAVPVLVDGGLVRGTDIFKALALGADAVLVGRPLMGALAAAGADGVTNMVQGMTAELARVMSLTGCRTVADIDASLIWGKRGRGI